MTFAVMPLYVAVLFTVFWFDNIREEQSLQPNFIWGGGGETFKADLLATVELDGYSASKCSTGRVNVWAPCDPDIRLIASGITGTGTTQCFTASKRKRSLL